MGDATLDVRIREIGLLGFARQLTGDEAITHVAMALWPNETSDAEKLAGGAAMRLATGGLVGDLASKTAPFGIVALSHGTFWRVKIGELLNGIDVSKEDHLRAWIKAGNANVVTKLPAGQVGLLSSDASDSCTMLVGVPGGRLIRVVFVDDLSQAFGVSHPVFGESGDNLRAGRELAAILAEQARTLVFVSGVTPEIEKLEMCAKCSAVKRTSDFTCANCGSTNRSALGCLLGTAVILLSSGILVASGWRWVLLALGGVVLAVGAQQLFAARRVRREINRNAAA